MENSIIAFIVCSAIVIIANLLYKYFTTKPSHTCNHELEVKEIRPAEGYIYTLSTCKKCGYQKVHQF